MPWNNRYLYGLGLSLILWVSGAVAETPDLPPAPSLEPEIVITVTVDKAKTSYGRRWDLNPFGTAPDVYGKVWLGRYPPQAIRLHMDSHFLKLRFKNYVLNVGEMVYIVLHDRDRARPDNLIAKGHILYTGKSDIQVRLQHAVIQLEFKGVHLTSW